MTEKDVSRVTADGPASRRQVGYPLPVSVADGFHHALHNCVVSNFGLAFHRFIKYTSDKTPNRPVWSWKTKKEPRGTNEHKPEMWQQVQKYASQCFSETAPATIALQSLRTRREAMAAAFAHAYGPACVALFQCAVGWRLAIGLGTANILENGITLHRVYGFPMIPGSAVKGLVRHREFCRLADQFKIPALPPTEVINRREKEQSTAWDRLIQYLESDECDEDEQQDRLQALAKESPEFKREQRQRQEEFRAAVERFRTVFGTPHQEGRVVFCDAMPVSLVVKGQPIVELDIVNPHFPKYYRDSTNAPTDGDNPSPNNFLVVRRGACFDFLLLSSDARVLGEYLPDVAKSTRLALTEIGIGAKTSANYGWFVGGEPLHDRQE